MPRSLLEDENPNQDLLLQRLHGLRERLLDLSNKNSLLTFKHSDRSRTHIRIIDELPNIICQKLLSGKPLRFLSLPDRENDPPDEQTPEFQMALESARVYDAEYIRASDAASEEDGSVNPDEMERNLRNRVREALKMSPWDKIQGDLRQFARAHGLNPDFELPVPDDRGNEPERHVDDQIQTRHYPKDMERKLRGIEDKARTMLQEMGINPLRAAFGFLQWCESESSSPMHLAPLILLPASLKRIRKNSERSFAIVHDGEELEVNSTLNLKLQRTFGYRLPDFGDDDTPESYLAKVSKSLAGQPRWRVRRFVTIGNFGFSRIALYHDLDPDRWPNNKTIARHPVIQEILQTKEPDTVNGTIPECAVEELEESRQAPILIDDADASQFTAIDAAVGGRSLVVQGPPGTGKSQTITNMIGAALERGKTLLFVCEKKAALDVVATRLKSAGLDDFCMELHSNKISKTSVLESLRRRRGLKTKSIEPEKLDDILDRRKRRRERVSRHFDDMQRRFGACQAAVHEIFWTHIRNGTEMGLAPDEAPGLTIQTAAALDKSDIDNAESQIRLAVKRRDALAVFGGSWSEHPWRWVAKAHLFSLGHNDAIRAVQKLFDAARALGTALSRTRDVTPENALESATALASYAEALSQISAFPRGQTAALVWAFHSSPPGGSEIEAALSLAKNLEESSAKAERISLPPLSADLGQIDSNWRGWIETIRLASERDGAGDPSLRTAKSLLDRLRADFDSLKRLENVCKIIAGDSAILEFSAETVRIVCKGASLAQSVDRGVLALRSMSKLSDPDRTLVASAQQKALKVAADKERLEAKFVLRPSPNFEETNLHAGSLRAAGFMSFFSSEVRNAKTYYKRITHRSVRLNPSAMAEDLTHLARHLADRKDLDEDRRLASLCAGWFGGADTDFEKITALDDWRKALRLEIGDLSTASSRLTAFLESAPAEDLEQVAAIASTIDFARVERLAEELGAGASWDDLKAGLEHRSDRLDRAICGASADLLPTDLTTGRWSELLDALRPLHRIWSRAAQESEDCGAEPVSIDVLMEAALLADRLARIGIRACDSPNHLETLFSDAAALAAKIETALDDYRDAVRQVKEYLEIDPKILGGAEHEEEMKFSLVESRLATALENPGGMSDWAKFLTAMQFEELPWFAEFAIGVVGSVADEKAAAAALRFAVSHALAKLAFREIPELEESDRLNIEQARKEFCDLDVQALEIQRKHVAAKLMRNRPPKGNNSGSARNRSGLALVDHELGKKKRNIAIRQLLARAGDAIQSLKPCFMMSPLSVATHLPPGSLKFDLVIIDEASQMRPEDAISAIARGRQVVIVGDPMQLPPTSFFQRFDDASDEQLDDEGDDEAIQSESILDQAMTVYRPHRRLTWHYRSQHENLIAFSNEHFYENGLKVFPSPRFPGRSLGVRYEKVNGVYENRCNPIEAERVAQVAIESILENPDRSLGIVTVNKLQQERISDLMEQRFNENPTADRFHQNMEDGSEPFFVKNLENVQGDERDVIVISTVYGPNKEGQVVQNFGPINSSNGHRRLNVLFTRAKQQTIVVTSLDPGNIRPNPQNPKSGVKIFRDYLDYAKSGRLDPGRLTDREPDSAFEIAVLNRLKASGYEGAPKIGVAEFFIDIAVRHPNLPDRFVLGIECDGAHHRMTLSARDRDRLRQDVLKKLGWRIHHIWSTDWFADPDKEMDRLVAAIQRAVEQEAQPPQLPLASPEDDARDAPEEPDHGARHTLTDIAGDEEIDDGDVTEAAFVDIPEPAQTVHSAGAAEQPTAKRLVASDQILVEVGDTVVCVSQGPPVQEDQFTIADCRNLEQGQVTKFTALGEALMGAEVGEEVEVSSGDSTRILLIKRIIKSSANDAEETRRETGETIDGGAETNHSRTANADSAHRSHPANFSAGPRTDYKSWESAPLKNPISSPTQVVQHNILKIVAAEGPVRTERVFRVYVRAAGLQKIGRNLRSALNKALYRLIEQNQVAIEYEGRDKIQLDAVLRLPRSPKVVLRTIGDRLFKEIPPSEIAATMREKQLDYPHLPISQDTLFHKTLAAYGMKRLTTNIKNELRRIHHKFVERN